MTQHHRTQHNINLNQKNAHKPTLKNRHKHNHKHEREPNQNRNINTKPT